MCISMMWQSCPAAQVLMFSATLHSDDVKQFAARVCRHPTLVDLKVRLPNKSPSAILWYYGSMIVLNSNPNMLCHKRLIRHEEEE